MTPPTTRSRSARALSLGLGALMIAGVSLAGATSAQAVPTSYTVSGTVSTKDDGTVTPRAGVDAAFYIQSPFTRFSATTGLDGSFVITGVPVGEYELALNLAGYGYVLVDVDIVDGNVDIGSITMLPYMPTVGTAAITGTGELGSTLTATTDGWPVGTEFTCLWFAPTRSSSGEIWTATASTFVVPANVIGRNVWVHVSGEIPGVYAPTDIDASNFVPAFAPQKPTGPAPADTSGSVPTGQTSVGLPATPLDPGTAHTANLEWFGADSFVDVYIFSTPTLVGTFPVVNGVAQITLSADVLSKLSAGTHTLVVTGQTSGWVQSVTLSLGLAATGSDMPIAPITAGALLLLLGGALVIARRRAPQKA